MKNRDLFKLGLQEFKSNKNKIINIVLMTISALLILLSVSYSQAISNYWNETAKSLIDFRTYYVYYDTTKYTEDQAIENLKKYNHITGVANSSSYLITMIANGFVNEKMDGTIYLEGTSKDGIETVLGKNLSDYSDEENVVVCAKQFYPKIEINMSDYDENNIVDISDKVGSYISLSFLGDKDSEEKLLLAGVYDARENYTEGNICYANFSTVEKLNQKYQYNVFNDKDAEYPLIMVIDSIDSKEEVLTEIAKDGYEFDKAMMQINPNNGNQIIIITSVASIIVVFITFLVNVVLLLKNIEDKRSYYSIMKSSGYVNRDLAKIQFIESLIMGMISFIISIPFTALSFILIKNLYFSSQIMYLNVDANFTIFGLLLCLLMFVAVAIISSIILNIKTKKVSIINEIK